MGRPKDINSGISHEEIRRLLTYKPDSGKFFWNQKINQVDGEAGWINPETGYRIIKVCGIKVMAHRLTWFWVYGEWPTDRLDHQNGNRDDQRIDNLRPASDRQNSGNTRTRKDNALGTKGVRLHESGRYQARIWDGKRHRHLGLFDTIEEAKAAYDAVATHLFGEFARAA